jgi:hypothetical protein
MGKVSTKELMLRLRKADLAHAHAMRKMERRHQRELAQEIATAVKAALAAMNERMANTNEWRGSLDDMLKKVMGAAWLLGILWIISIAVFGLLKK